MFIGEEKVKKKKKRFEIILGVIILLISVFLAASFYAYTLNYKSQSTMQLAVDATYDSQPESSILSEISFTSSLSEASISNVSSLSESSTLEATYEIKAYLTFDDGPSANTLKILDTLNENNVKATFFVVGPESEFSRATIRREFDEGHEIALHCYSHANKTLYTTRQGFLNDFNHIERYVMDIIGIKPTLYRFPNGTNYAKSGFLQPIISELKGRGYTYCDWDVSSGDGDARLSKETVLNNVLSQCREKIKVKSKRAVILMHDSQSRVSTAEALPEIIKGLKEMGFTFDILHKENVVQFKPR